jgi:addiction module HigA family antidote
MNCVRIRTHPGEILLEEFMKPLGLSANALARELHVPPNRITAIIATTAPRAVTPDTALRLSRYFGTTPQFWLNLKSAHDLSLVLADIGDRVAAEVRPRAA